MEKSYKLGTRASPLALKQVEEIRIGLKRTYPEIKMEPVTIETAGDRDRDTPISDIEGSNFFTKEIDEKLIAGEIDFAVHSAKDLPGELRAGLVIAAITEAIDPAEALVSKSGLTLEQLPQAARIGTSSSRRKAQLKKFRSDFQVVDIRGNIEERLELLDHTEHRTPNTEHRKLDAIVIAAAGLIRLGLEQKITQRIPPAILRPHPLQGALAVVARAEDIKLRELISTIDCQKAT